MFFYVALGAFAGVIACCLLFVIMGLKGGPWKLPAIGMAVCFVALIASTVFMNLGGGDTDDPGTANQPSAPVGSADPGESVNLEGDVSASPNEGQASKEPAETQPTETDGARESESTPPASESLPPPDIDLVMSVLRATLAQNFGENNFTLEYDNTAATINIWGSDIALGAAVAASGDKNAKAAWNTVIEGQKLLCNSVVEQVESTGIKDYLVMINVLNDLDKDRTLLTIFNGAVIYDVVNS